MKTKHNTNSSVMKNIFLLMLLITGMVKAQIVTIPDANFKAKLIAQGIDTNGDGDIQQSEATAVTQISVSGTFAVYGNIVNLTGIQAFSNLQSLRCNYNQITSIDLSGLTNLQTLDCGKNQLSSLNVSGLTNLRNLYCEQNQLSSLDASGLTNLRDLYCEQNQLDNLVVSGLTNLEVLWCDTNQLTSLNVSGLTNLQILCCNQNQLSSIDVSGLTNLEVLWVNNNQITNLDVSVLTNLQQLNCSFNQLSSLDVSELPNLIFLNCARNLLTALFIKNGSIESTLIFGVNPNLSFICADEDQVSSVQAQAESNVVVSSYCSFTPGGDYNTVSGVVRFDMDNNGCDVSDSAFPFSAHLNITEGTVSSGTFPTTNGSYSLYTLTGTNTLTTSLENPSYFNISPSNAIIDFLTFGNTQTQDFCITANGVHNDVEIVIAPITQARPGFDAVYQIVFKNKGNQTLSGNITFIYNDVVLDFVSATLAPDTQNTGLLNWNYSDLQPFENRSFDVTLNVNSPTETPAVNNGDILNFEATITPVIGDDIPEDNLFTFNQTVVGSFDPNDITCLEGDVVPATEIGKYLHYVINFENTGTFPAENVVVKTEVDASKFDIGSLQLMNANFSVDARITGNKVEFIFENIQLPIGGHGHILLKIKTQNTLVTGDAVANRGDIFFDYNFPIDTGLANTVFQTLSNSVFEVDSSVAVYPNPAINEVTITADNKIKSIQLYDAQGRIILTRLIDDLESKLELSSYSKGIYFIKITTEKGAQVQKLIKD